MSSAEQSSERGDDDEGFGDGGELLVVAYKAAVLEDPG
jgi:hypothetical protein